jgi:hypothetical protein
MQQESAMCEPENRPSSEVKCADLLISVFPSSRTVREKFLWLMPSGYGILVFLQPKCIKRYAVAINLILTTKLFFRLNTKQIE